MIISTMYFQFSELLLKEINDFRENISVFVTDLLLST